MFFYLLRDFIFLFLLMYALITLAEKLCNLFSRLCKEQAVIAKKIYIIDISEVSHAALECFLRKELSTCRCTVFLTSEKKCDEADFIITRLQKQYPETYFLTKKELKKMLNNQLKTGVFSKPAQAADPDQGK